MLGGVGGLWEFKASLLASHGFAALALAYIAYDDIPESPSSMEMEYFEEAANWLSNHPKVLPHGIGVHAIWDEGGQSRCGHFTRRKHFTPTV